MAQCGICLEEGVEEVGELPGCTHVYCFPCISRWAESENRCPSCRETFSTISRKRLAPDSGHEELGPGKRLKGDVLETVTVEDKRQRYCPEDLLGVDLDNLRCEICGTGENEECLMLCDGCDRGFHLYCVGLHALPEEEWYCGGCAQERAVLRQAARTRRRAGRSGAGGGQGDSLASFIDEDEDDEDGLDDELDDDDDDVSLIDSEGADADSAIVINDSGSDGDVVELLESTPGPRTRTSSRQAGARRRGGSRAATARGSNARSQGQRQVGRRRSGRQAARRSGSASQASGRSPVLAELMAATAAAISRDRAGSRSRRQGARATATPRSAAQVRAAQRAQPEATAAAQAARRAGERILLAGEPSSSAVAPAHTRATRSSSFAALLDDRPLEELPLGELLDRRRRQEQGRERQPAAAAGPPSAAQARRDLLPGSSSSRGRAGLGSSSRGRAGPGVDQRAVEALRRGWGSIRNGEAAFGDVARGGAVRGAGTLPGRRRLQRASAELDDDGRHEGLEDSSSQLEEVVWTDAQRARALRSPPGATQETGGRRRAVLALQQQLLRQGQVASAGAGVGALAGRSGGVAQPSPSQLARDSVTEVVAARRQMSQRIDQRQRQSQQQQQQPRNQQQPLQQQSRNQPQPLQQQEDASQPNLFARFAAAPVARSAQQGQQVRPAAARPVPEVRIPDFLLPDPSTSAAGASADARVGSTASAPALGARFGSAASAPAPWARAARNGASSGASGSVAARPASAGAGVGVRRGAGAEAGSQQAVGGALSRSGVVSMPASQLLGSAHSDLGDLGQWRRRSGSAAATAGARAGSGVMAAAGAAALARAGAAGGADSAGRGTGTKPGATVGAIKPGSHDPSPGSKAGGQDTASDNCAGPSHMPGNGTTPLVDRHCGSDITFDAAVRAESGAEELGAASAVHQVKPEIGRFAAAGFGVKPDHGGAAATGLIVKPECGSTAASGLVIRPECSNSVASTGVGIKPKPDPGSIGARVRAVKPELDSVAAAAPEVKNDLGIAATVGNRVRMEADVACACAASAERRQADEAVGRGVKPEGTQAGCACPGSVDGSRQRQQAGRPGEHAPKTTSGHLKALLGHPSSRQSSSSAPMGMTTTAGTGPPPGQTACLQAGTGPPPGQTACLQAGTGPPPGQTALLQGLQGGSAGSPPGQAEQGHPCFSGDGGLRSEQQPTHCFQQHHGECQQQQQQQQQREHDRQQQREHDCQLEEQQWGRQLHFQDHNWHHKHDAQQQHQQQYYTQHSPPQQQHQQQYQTQCSPPHAFSRPQLRHSGEGFRGSHAPLACLPGEGQPGVMVLDSALNSPPPHRHHDVLASGSPHLHQQWPQGGAQPLLGSFWQQQQQQQQLQDGGEVAHQPRPVSSWQQQQQQLQGEEAAHQPQPGFFWQQQQQQQQQQPQPQPRYSWQQQPQQLQQQEQQEQQEGPWLWHARRGQGGTSINKGPSASAPACLDESSPDACTSQPPLPRSNRHATCGGACPTQTPAVVAGTPLPNGTGHRPVDTIGHRHVLVSNACSTEGAVQVPSMVAGTPLPHGTSLGGAVDVVLATPYSDVLQHRQREEQQQQQQQSGSLGSSEAACWQGQGLFEQQQQQDQVWKQEQRQEEQQQERHQDRRREQAQLQQQHQERRQDRQRQPRHRGQQQEEQRDQDRQQQQVQCGQDERQRRGDPQQQEEQRDQDRQQQQVQRGQDERQRRGDRQQQQEEQRDQDGQQQVQRGQDQRQRRGDRQQQEQRLRESQTDGKPRTPGSEKRKPRPSFQNAGDPGSGLVATDDVKARCFDLLKKLMRPAFEGKMAEDKKQGMLEWKEVAKLALHLARARVEVGQVSWEQVLVPGSDVAWEAVRQALHDKGLQHPLLLQDAGGESPSC